jgi:hypothetical protein
MCSIWHDGDRSKAAEKGAPFRLKSADAKARGGFRCLRLASRLASSQLRRRGSDGIGVSSPAATVGVSDQADFTNEEVRMSATATPAELPVGHLGYHSEADEPGHLPDTAMRQRMVQRLRRSSSSERLCRRQAGSQLSGLTMSELTTSPTFATRVYQSTRFGVETSESSMDSHPSSATAWAGSTAKAVSLRSKESAPGVRRRVSGSVRT